MNSRFKDKASLASLILHIVVKRECICEDRQKCLDLLTQTKEFVEVSGGTLAKISTIDHALDMLREVDPN